MNIRFVWQASLAVSLLWVFGCSNMGMHTTGKNEMSPADTVSLKREVAMALMTYSPTAAGEGGEKVNKIRKPDPKLYRKIKKLEQMGVAMDMDFPAEQLLGYKENDILVKYKDDVPEFAADASHYDMGARKVKSFKSFPKLHLVTLPNNDEMEKALAAYRARDDIEYAEPNYIVYATQTPNDPGYSELWGLHNDNDEDINAPQAWDITTGSNDVVIGVIDSGIDYNHPDLQANMWVNPNEIPGNGKDDDRNGYVDDIYCINPLYGTSDPMDDNSHGSHCAGTIGAVGNNGIGVAGVNWNVKMIGCKMLDNNASGTTAAAIECLEYFSDLKASGINIVATNNSWGGGPASNTLKRAIDDHLAKGILFVAAAGNESNNNDSNPSYPASYPQQNLISVAAIDSSGDQASFSNYGTENVDIAAPGVNILSTTPNGGYQSFNGTSMATPHVTGLVALLAAHKPDYNWLQLRNTIYASGVPTQGVTTMTQRRIRAYDTNGQGALTCDNAALRQRFSPSTSQVELLNGDTLDIKLLNITCGDSGAPITVTVEETGETFELLDDGLGADTAAHDGEYVGQYQHNTDGTVHLNIGEFDTLTVGSFNWYTAGQVKPLSYFDTSNGTVLPMYDDSFSQISLPFSVQIGDTSVNQLSVGSNGLITSANNTVSGSRSNQMLPSSHTDWIVAPYWDDLNPSGSDTSVVWSTVGNKPGRKLVIEWQNVPFYGYEDANKYRLNFQAVFHENKSSIAFNYKTMYSSTKARDKSTLATVGIQANSAIAELYSYNQAIISENSTVLFVMEGETDSEYDDGISNVNRIINIQNVGEHWQRTVVFMYGQTQVGQDMFMRGGIDWGYAQNNLGKDCGANADAKWLCAIPIRHRQFQDDPLRANDSYLDWHGAQPGQGIVEGSPLTWTTNQWPSDWGPRRTVLVDGYGEEPLNIWGHHYWMLDVDIDCSKTVDGWFELKSYISNGPGWEGNVGQAGTPYQSGNHFARCGYINTFRRGDSWADIRPF